MKPSERRALEAQKRAQKEAELKARASAENETEAACETGELTVGGTDPINQDRKRRKVREASKQKRENIFKRYPRLIAFVATSFVIITLLSPIAVDGFLSLRENWGIVNDKQDLTIEQVYFISDNYGNITWKSFEGFNYTARRRGWKGYRNEYPIKDTSFTLVVGGKTKAGAPEYIYIQSYIDGEVRDLYDDDIREFVDKYNKKAE